MSIAISESTNTVNTYATETMDPTVSGYTDEMTRESRNGVRALSAIPPFHGLLVEEHLNVLPNIENAVSYRDYPPGSDPPLSSFCENQQAIANISQVF